MTNRPTDDFETTETDAIFENGDDEAAAFGDRKAEATPASTDALDDVEADIAEQYDDSDFVADDGADVIEEYDAEASATDADYDPLAEDGEPYPTADEIYEQPADKKSSGGMMDKFKAMKTADKIFYGLFAVGGLGALYFVFTMTLGAPPAQDQQMNILNAPVVADAANTQPVLPTVQQDANAPIENPAEPTPDVIGVQGGQSTLNSADALAPLPPTVPDAPPVQDAAPVEQASDIVEAANVQPQVQAAAEPVIEPAVQQAAAPNAEQAQLQAQLEAQQQSMQQLQAQLQAQTEAMKQLQAQRDADAKSRELSTVTSPPPLVKSDNPALNQLATDMGVRLAELNARLTQVSESLNRLQETTTKLDQQNAELQNKAKDLTDKVGTQASKITELANKEPPATVDKATVDKIKANVEQVERKLATIVKSQAASAPVAAPSTAMQAAPQRQMQKPAAAQSYITPSRAPEREMVEAPRAAPQSPPLSPKARDLQGYDSTPAKTTWVLRAATPTMAWLSPRAGSAELKRVAPGDAVDGIGQVLEIKQELGRWVVIGTTGTVR